MQACCPIAGRESKACWQGLGGTGKGLLAMGGRPPTPFLPLPSPHPSCLAQIEPLRLEVDSRKRTVASLAAATDAMRTKMGMAPEGADAKAQYKLEQTVQKLQHKEGKLKGGWLGGG